MAKKLPYKKLVLPNGLTIILVKMETVKTFSAVTNIKVGGANETSKNRGISHFLEHLVFQGSRNYPSYKALAEKVEFEGMYEDGQTSKTATSFLLASPSEKAAKAINFLYEIVFLSTLPESRLENTREVILSEYYDYWTQPVNKFRQKMIFKRTKNKNIYQYSSLGEPKTIKSFTREDLLSWKNKYYQPANMILSLAGNFNQNEVIKTIKNTFGKEKTTKAREELPKPKITYSDFLVSYQKDKPEQIKFFLTFPTFGFQEAKTKKLIQLEFLNSLVGNSHSSRLSKLLREDNNLVYFVTSATSSLPFLGEFIITGSVGKNNLLKTLELIKKELEKIKKNGVGKKELQKAQNLYQRDTVCFNFETPQQIANWVAGEEFYFQKIRLPDDYMKIARSVSLEEVNRLAKSIFDFSRLNVGLLGNLKNEEIGRIESIFKSKN